MTGAIGTEKLDRPEGTIQQEGRQERRILETIHQVETIQLVEQRHQQVLELQH
jgi:hypothetical protein